MRTRDPDGAFGTLRAPFHIARIVPGSPLVARTSLGNVLESYVAKFAPGLVRKTTNTPLTLVSTHGEVERLVGIGDDYATIDARLRSIASLNNGFVVLDSCYGGENAKALASRGQPMGGPVYGGDLYGRDLRRIRGPVFTVYGPRTQPKVLRDSDLRGGPSKGIGAKTGLPGPTTSVESPPTSTGGRVIEMNRNRIAISAAPGWLDGPRGRLWLSIAEISYRSRLPRRKREQSSTSPRRIGRVRRRASSSSH